MIVWNGLGILVPIIAFLFFLVANLAADGLLGEGFYESHGWPKLAAALVGAVSIWFLGRYLNSRGTRTLIDEETGEKVVLGNKHSLFFLKMEYWAFVLVGFGVVMLLVEGK